MAMASMAASDSASVVRLQRHTTSQAARYGLTSSRKPVTVTSRSTPSVRARASTTPRVGPSDQQSSRGEACPAQPCDGFDELDVVLLGPQHRGDPDHVVAIRVAELGTQCVPLERAAVVLKMPRVDAVVDHRVAA